MIYAIYLFAACKYNYFVESKETFWLPDPGFFPCAPEGLVRYVKDRMLKDRLTTEQRHYILKTDKRQNAHVA